MKNEKSLLTEEEVELAKKLYADAKANGTLKAPRVIAISVGRSQGIIQTTKASTVTWRDYIVDARKALRPKGM